MASKKPWRIIPRPLLETILNNHAQHHRVHQPLLLHGPRGVGKTTLILERLLNDWNKAPHITGYVDFAESIKPQTSPSLPWASWSTSPPPTLSDCRKSLDQCLEAMTEKALRMGAITSRQIFNSLNKWHGLSGSLRRVLNTPASKGSPAVLWDRAVLTMASQCNADEIDRVLGFGENEKNVFKGGEAAEIHHFQPKLVLNNIEVLKHATVDDEFSVTGPLYHDSLIWRIIALGANEQCLPVILVTSDGYYSYEAFLDFGYMEIFISRETFGWTPQEAQMHMVTDYFSHSEWKVIAGVLGPNPRHLFELYALKQNNYLHKTTADRDSTFEDIVDAYLAYLQISVVNPALDGALEILQKFAIDVRNGKISDDRLRFGAPWRHPPKVDDPKLRMEWAKLQLMDSVKSLVNADFGVNYRIEYSEEIFDDPSAVALLQVGLLYAQRDPPFFRPISRGIQRCLVRWLVQQRMQLRLPQLIRFQWHRLIRGRYYRHLMVQVDNKY
ncbi:unnamed protein product [Vicia faba]|uniref:Uncharacterized protein n=1 Tax=Vicia faba TaxID=3906 RepID=A0AAV0ZM03_VICFA|nr:unnamed protein product [Vicia faba]